MYYLLLALAIMLYLAYQEKLDVQNMSNLQNHQILLIFAMAVLLYCEYYKINILNKFGLTENFDVSLAQVVDTNLNSPSSLDKNNYEKYDKKRFVHLNTRLQINTSELQRFETYIQPRNVNGCVLEISNATNVNFIGLPSSDPSQINLSQYKWYKVSILNVNGIISATIEVAAN